MFGSVKVSHVRVLLVAGLIAAASLVAISATLASQAPSFSMQGESGAVVALSGAAPAFAIFDAPGAGTGSLQGTAATTIDGSGNVAGVFFDAGDVEHAFVRTAAGVITTFDAPGAGTSTESSVTVPIGFDGRGNLMGITSDSNAGAHGFVRSASTGVVTLFDVPGAGKNSNEGTYPSSINAAGQITGVYIGADDLIHGFVRSATGSITVFDAYPSGNQQGKSDPGTFVVGINAGGDVAGSFMDVNGVVHGFVRIATTGKITTFDAPGASLAENRGTGVMGIDTAGDIAGAYVDATERAHGFVRSAKGVFTTIDAPGAGTAKDQGTAPLGIDANGDITGMYTDGANIVRGFVRSASGTISTYSAPGASLSANLSKRTTGKPNAVAGHSSKASRVGGLLNKAKSFINKIGGSSVQSSGVFSGLSGVLNGDGGMYFGTGGFGSVGITGINATGAITGIFTDGDSVAHGFLRASNGTVTSFDAPGAGTSSYQGTAGISINAAGTIVGAYADSNSVIHAFVLTMAQVATTAKISSTPSASVFGQPVTLTATLTSSGGTPPNGETVWFMNNGTTSLGAQPLSGGTAKLTTTLLPEAQTRSPWFTVGTRNLPEVHRCP